MFTKRVQKGSITVGQRKPIYKTVIDWEAIGGFIFLAFIALVLLSMCSAS